MPLTLPPAQKAVPAPVIRSAPTSGFSPQVLIIVRNAGVKLSDSALRTSGRFSVMTATRPRITHSSSLVPVSIVISVVMFPPFLLSSSLRGAKRTKQSSVFLVCMDCFAKLVIGRRFAPTRWLAMTVVNPSSKLLHPGPQFHFPGPGAARLLQHVPVTQGNGVGIEHRIRLVGRLGARGAANAAVDDEVRDVNALRR